MSRASLSVASLDGRLAAPAELSDRERAIWMSIVGSKPAGWFDAGMAPLLRSLVAHAATFEDLQRELAGIGDMKNLSRRRFWIEKLLTMRRAETACISALSTKMRLSAQSRYTPQAAGSAVRGFMPRAPAPNVFVELRRRTPKQKPSAKPDAH